MAGISCGGVWFGGGGGPQMKACEVALGNIIDGLDEDNNGKVRIDMFVKFLNGYGINIDSEEVHEMEKLADEHGELGKHALKTFSRKAWFWNDLEPQAETIYRESKKVAVAFNMFDRNNDGYVTKAEFGRTLKNLKETQINAIFKKYDENADEKLTQEEFKTFMNARKFRKND
jgi:Ca2+-binding EF-hand superfamily protein